jgi:hypothetical protein
VDDNSVKFWRCGPCWESERLDLQRDFNSDVYCGEKYGFLWGLRAIMVLKEGASY